MNWSAGIVESAKHCATFARTHFALGAIDDSDSYGVAPVNQTAKQNVESQLAITAQYAFRSIALVDHSLKALKVKERHCAYFTAAIHIVEGSAT